MIGIWLFRTESNMKGGVFLKFDDDCTQNYYILTKKEQIIKCKEIYI